MKPRGSGLTLAVALIALCSAGCGSSTPPPAKGGVQFNVLTAGQNAPANEACDINTSPFSIAKLPPSDQSAGTPIVDGEGNASVTCRVSGSGSYSFSGTLQLSASSFSVQSGTVSKDGTGHAEMQVYNPVNNGVTLSSPQGAPCAIKIVQAAPGRIWASFACDGLESQPSIYCGASGWFVFEDCDQ